MPQDPSIFLVVGLGAVVLFLFWQRKARRSSEARASLKSLLDEGFEFQPSSESEPPKQGGGKTPLASPFGSVDQEDDD